MAGVTTPRRLSYGAVAAGAGGLILILSLFLDWAGGFSGWSTFDFIDIVLFVIGLLAIGFAVLEVTGAAVNLPVDRVRALTIIGIIATTIVVSFFIESDQQIGVVLAALAAIAILVGGILAERSPHLALELGGGGPGAGAGGGGYAQPQGGGYAQPPAQQQQSQPVAQPPQYAQPPAAAAGPGDQATSIGAVQPPPQAAPAPPAGGAADWYPDPRGEKRLRYWDGTQWTQHVAD
jgi:hypothetical protein